MAIVSNKARPWQSPDLHWHGNADEVHGATPVSGEGGSGGATMGGQLVFERDADLDPAQAAIVLQTEPIVESGDWGYAQSIVWKDSVGNVPMFLMCSTKAPSTSSWWIECKDNWLSMWADNSLGANFGFETTAYGTRCENGLVFKAAPLGQSPVIMPTESGPSDPNIDLLVKGKGTGVVKTPDGALRPWVQITQAAYDALSPPNANTLYVIVG